MIDFLGLEEFRQSLPEPERNETYRFFMMGWDIVKARFLIQETGKQQDVLQVREAAHAYGLDTPQTFDSAVYVNTGVSISKREKCTLSRYISLQSQMSIHDEMLRERIAQVERLS